VQARASEVEVEEITRDQVCYSVQDAKRYLWVYVLREAAEANIELIPVELPGQAPDVSDALEILPEHEYPTFEDAGIKQ
jgi:hypothetical protein